MIGSLDSDRDLVSYVETEEIPRLCKEIIEGILIKFHKPKQQGQFFLSLNEARSNENGMGIGVVEEGYSYNTVGRFELFMSNAVYRELRERGIVGLRYGRMGSKVHLYDRSRLDGIDKIMPENLEFYRDNRERLLDDFG